MWGIACGSFWTTTSMPRSSAPWSTSGTTPGRVGAAGLGRARDNDVAVYAAERAAVLVTHDRRFVRNLLRNGFATVIWLNCPDDRAAEVMTHWAGELERRLVGRRDELAIEVRVEGVRLRRSQWRAARDDGD
jgi:predicted nuclease of predicted toxin-antitoxin system